MRLLKFIDQHEAKIVEAWQQYAETMPGTAEMNTEDLRDHVVEMLHTICRQMASPQRQDTLTPLPRKSIGS